MSEYIICEFYLNKAVVEKDVMKKDSIVKYCWETSDPQTYQLKITNV